MPKFEMRTIATVMADTQVLGRVAIRMAFESLPMAGEELVAHVGGKALKMRVRNCRHFPAATPGETAIILDCDNIDE